MEQQRPRGPAADAPAADEQIDAGGRAVIPGFVDSHSHLVFAGDRAEEFAARMAGPPYAAGGRVTFVTGGRRTVVRHARASTFAAPRGGGVRIPAGGARDRYGNYNAGDVPL